jgi:adenosylcobinamide-GDP ribazoletransferase
MFIVIQGKLGGAVGDLYGFTLEVSRTISLMLIYLLYIIMP